MANKIENVELDKLILDPDNPRFAELYNGSKDEEDLIEYLLNNESANEIAQEISRLNQFYIDRPLWVIKKGSKYLVKDGNRRCAAAKALQLPGFYKLPLNKMRIKTLPVIIYKDVNQLNNRIIKEHATPVFRGWERIAKAIEVLKLSKVGDLDTMREIDSNPGDLIKLASFYYEAVKISGDELRILFRRGRGKTGGKTIIFERLFRDRKECGYQFKNSPSFLIDIKNQGKFSSYVKALVKYLKDFPETKTQTVDNDKDFLDKLIPYGFDRRESYSNEKNKSGSSTKDSQNFKKGREAESAKKTESAYKRGTIKTRPDIGRKNLSPTIKNKVKECFDLNPEIYPNSKLAMVRVTFECVLKYVVEKTEHNGRTPMSKLGYFGTAYKSRYTDFTLLNTLFTGLIKNTSIRKAFENFKLEQLHQIIHNYEITGITQTAKQYTDNLIPLLEFLLQNKEDLLLALNTEKLSK